MGSAHEWKLTAAFTNEIQPLSYPTTLAPGAVLRWRLLRVCQGMTPLQNSAFRAIAEALDDPLFLVDEWWRPQWCNEAAAALVTGASVPRDGREFLGIFDTETRDRLVLGGDACTGATPWRGEGVLGFDPTRGVTIAVSRHTEGLPTGWRTVRLSDGTPRQHLEKSLGQARQLDGITRLAEVLAHEFAEVLTAISGSAAMITSELAPRDVVHADLEMIRLVAARAAVLTRELHRALSSRTAAPQCIDASRAVATMAGALRRVAGAGVEVRLSLAPDPVAVLADVSQLEGSMMHLVRNARDAMPAGGVLEITTSRAEFTHPCRAVHSLIAPGQYIQIEVCDHGVGMDQNTASHCFDPLFSTWGAEGLGLSLVFGAITQMGGYVRCDSTIGQGTTMSLLLPIVAPDKTAPAQGVAGLRSILVVDDDEAVRQVAARTLRRAGYRVVEATNADEALALVFKDPSVADLLLTDIRMPGLSGIGLAKCIVDARPDARVLFCSGASAIANGLSERLPRAAAFLPKPFTPEALSQRVRQLFEG